MKQTTIRLGFDLGTHTTGCAKSIDSVIVGADSITTNSDPELQKAVLERIRAEKSKEVIIGLPLNSEGQPTKQSTWIREVVAELKLQTSCPIFFVNEFLSTRVTEFPTPGADDNEQAARTILEQYLKEGGERV